MCIWCQNYKSLPFPKQIYDGSVGFSKKHLDTHSRVHLSRFWATAHLPSLASNVADLTPFHTYMPKPT